MKRLAARTSHTPNDTHDHSEITASDVTVSGQGKRGLDSYILGGSVSVVPSSGVFLSVSNEINSIAQSATVDVVSYTVPAGKTYKLDNASVSGNNIGVFKFTIDGSNEETKRTTVTNINENFNLQGYEISEGSTVKIEVTNASDTAGDFEAVLRGYVE